MRTNFFWAVVLAPKLAFAEDATPKPERPAIVFVDPEIGSSYTNLRLFYGRNVAFQKTSDGGILLGASAGVNAPLYDHHSITFGVFGHLHGETGYNVKQLGGFAGYRWGRGGTGFFVVSQIGPLWVDNFDTGSLSPSTTASAGDLSLGGFSVGLHGGADAAVWKVFTLGFVMGFDVFTWTRARLSPPPAIMGAAANDPLYASGGAGTGLILTCALRVGVAGL